MPANSDTTRSRCGRLVDSCPECLAERNYRPSRESEEENRNPLPPMMKFSTLLIALFITTSAVADKSAFEQHGAHVHGEAKLTIAQDGNHLEMEFVSPGMNIVGFEHPPADQAQTQAVNAALAILNQPQRVFGFPAAAGCEPSAINVHTSSEHHEHEGADHDSGETHSEFSASYRLECADTSQLDHIGINIFKLFPGTRVIDAQSITDRGQKQADLTPDSASFNF